MPRSGRLRRGGRPAAPHRFPTEELVMGIFSRFGSRRRGKPDRLRRWVMPTGHDDPELDEIKRAASADVAALEEDDKYFRADGPGKEEDDL
jgi:hypothetical protein